MNNWEELIDNCVKDEEGMEKAFRITESQFDDRKDIIAMIQQEYQSGGLTNAEFTASLIGIAKNTQELLYLVQLSGAQIFQTKQPFRQF